MNIVLIGANGQLGSDLARVIVAQGHDLTPLTHADIEVTDQRSVEAAFARHHPDVVINTAAFHRVDVCEKEVEKAFAVNVCGVHNLALSCRAHGAALVHISTDYVFGGDDTRDEPYVESDLPAPVNMYGVSKLAGEHAVRYILDRYYIFRVAGLYGVAGSSGKGGNFVELMLRLAHEGKDIHVVDDQRTTPTYTLDLARQISTTPQAREIAHGTSSRPRYFAKAPSAQN